MKKPLIEFWWRSGSRRNSYLTNWLARLDSLTYTKPNEARISAIDLMLTTIGNTHLSKLDIFFLFAFNDVSLSDASRVNLITPTSFEATFVNSPTYGVKGIRPNGSTSYVDTNFNPATNGVNYTQNSASRGFYVETIPTIGTAMDGAISLTGRNNTTYGASTNNVKINSGSNLLNAVVNTSGVGYKSIVRVDSTNVSFYNGTTKSDRTQTSAAMTSEDQTIGKSGTNFSNAEFGFYDMGGSTTEQENNNKKSAYETYRTAIGL